MARLSREFYMGDTVEVARALLGKYLVRTVPDGTVLAVGESRQESYPGATQITLACAAKDGKLTLTAQDAAPQAPEQKN